MSADALFERLARSRRREAQDRLRACGPRAKRHLPRSLHRRLARRREDRPRRRQARAHRAAAEAGQDQGAHDRSHRLLRQAGVARPRDASTARSPGAAGALRIGDGAPSVKDDAPRAASSRPRAPALLRDRRARSSIRAGSRSTRSRAAASSARGRASRAGRRPWRRRAARGLLGVRGDASQRLAARRAAARGDLRGDDFALGGRAPSSERARGVSRGATRRSPSAPHAELLRRLAFVEEVGLGYLALDRPAATLSGGEMQRLRLSAQLGQRPHRRALRARRAHHRPAPARHAARCCATCAALADMGSTVLVVEHDAETIRAADHVIDLGPAGGRNGGHIVVRRTRRAGALRSAIPDRARAPRNARASTRPKRPMADAWIELSGARAHNLQRRDLPRPGRSHVRRRGRERVGQVDAGAARLLPGASPRAQARGAASRARTRPSRERKR